jgi:hypothetical protein
MLPIDIPAMTDVDDDHKKSGSEDTIDNTAAPYAVGMKTFERSLESLPPERVRFKRIENIGNAPVETLLPLCDPPQNGFGLMGEFQFIFFQVLFSILTLRINSTCTAYP